MTRLFKFTKEEERQMQKALKKAVAFMCDFGKPPVLPPSGTTVVRHLRELPEELSSPEIFDLFGVSSYMLTRGIKQGIITTRRRGAHNIFFYNTSEVLLFCNYLNSRPKTRTNYGLDWTEKATDSRL